MDFYSRLIAFSTALITLFSYFLRYDYTQVYRLQLNIKGKVAYLKGCRTVSILIKAWCEVSSGPVAVPWWERLEGYFFKVVAF